MLQLNFGIFSKPFTHTKSMEDIGPESAQHIIASRHDNSISRNFSQKYKAVKQSYQGRMKYIHNH